MTDRVDTAMDVVKRPAPEPALDRTGLEPKVAQLSSADHPVLLARESRDGSIGPIEVRSLATRAALSFYAIGNAALVGHRPIVAKAGASVARKTSRFSHELRPNRKEKRSQPAGTASGFDPLK
jgi:hypothetical protein